MTLDYWRKVFSVNLEGPLRMSQCVCADHARQGGGSIVNIGTMAAYSGGGTVRLRRVEGRAPQPHRRAMAMEWAPWKIRVNMPRPGPFISEMMEGGERTAPGLLRARRRRDVHEAHRRPAEIVGPVCYLVSDASSFVTGDDLSVSGGMMK